MRGELQKLNGADVVAAFDRGDTVTLRMDDTDVVLSKEDVLVEAVKKEGFTSQVNGSLTVVLDTTLTDQLVQEGYAREVISKLQSMRKDFGLDVTDRIHVYCTGSEKVLNALNVYGDMVKAGVLAHSLTLTDAPDGAYRQDWDINGEGAMLAIVKA